MQPIYPISKEELSMNLDCNWQAIELRHDRNASLTETDVRSQDRQQGNATDHLYRHKANNALLHIYSLIVLNLTNSS